MSNDRIVCRTFLYDLLYVINNAHVSLTTSDNLNEGLPIKMAKEMFQRKLYVFMKKIVGSVLDLSAKVLLTTS